MLTYEDLEKCGDSEDRIREFIYGMIDQQSQNPRYLEGVTAGEFFRSGDPEMQKYEHIIYDLNGEPRKDVLRANHKITSDLYNLFVTQEVTHLLGNGVTFKNKAIKEKLGNKFDYKLQKLVTWGANDSESYAYLTSKGIEIFNVACDDEEPHFIPIFSLTDRKQPKAGIRHWRASEFSPLNCILYRSEGYTIWQEIDGKLQIVQPNKPYEITYRENAIGERWNIEQPNFGELPIIPFFYTNHKSAIHNHQDLLHSFNLTVSGLSNNTNQINLLYWVIKNADGMDDLDFESFVANLYKSQILPLRDGVEAEPHEIRPDFEAHQATIAELRARLFEDFKAVDVSNIQGGNKTTVEIHAAYENLNRKCDDLEIQVGEFLEKVLKFYGFDENEEFSFTRPPEINVTEYMTMLSSISGTILTEEDAMKQGYSALGMIDMYEAAARKKAADELHRMTAPTGDDADDTDRQLPGRYDRR